MRTAGKGHFKKDCPALANKKTKNRPRKLVNTEMKPGHDYTLSIPAADSASTTHIFWAENATHNTCGQTQDQLTACPTLTSHRKTTSDSRNIKLHPCLLYTSDAADE